MFPTDSLEKTKYAPLSLRDDGDDPLPADVKPRPRGLWRVISQPVFPWTFAAFFASLSLFLGMLVDRDHDLWQSNQELGTFATGYATDFGTLIRGICEDFTRKGSFADFHRPGKGIYTSLAATLHRWCRL
jgi:hypothetical protein